MPVGCPPLPPGRVVRAPDRSTSRVIECLDHYAPIAEAVQRSFESDGDEQVRLTSAYILKSLWERNLLPDSVKDRLVERHYKPTIIQVLNPERGLELQLIGQTSFTFPSVPTFNAYRVRYRNGRPDTPANRIDLEATSLLGPLSVTYQIDVFEADQYTPGDTYFFDVVLEEVDSNRDPLWRKVIRTAALTVR